MFFVINPFRNDFIFWINLTLSQIYSQMTFENLQLLIPFYTVFSFKLMYSTTSIPSGDVNLNTSNLMFLTSDMMFNALYFDENLKYCKLFSVLTRDWKVGYKKVYSFVFNQLRIPSG